MTAITTVLLDLDGVIRHFDPAHPLEVEDRHGLESGALEAAAFSDELLLPAITGGLTRDRWVAEVGQSVGSQAAAEEWLGRSGVIDADLMAEVAGLRRGGVTVAVLTNGTSTIREELRQHAIADSFDAVFNSYEIGFAKPDTRAFAHVCVSLACDPRSVFFTDDSQNKLTGALELGMTATHYEGLATFQSQVSRLLGL